MPTIAELGQKVKAKHPGAYEDIPDAELGRRVKSKYPGSYDDFSDSTGAPPMAMTAQNNPLAQAAMMTRDQSLGYLPAFGGLVGASMGGIPGAAIGGAAGEGLRQYGMHEKPSPLGIAGQGAAQGALEFGGGLLAKGAERLARPLMQKALGIVPSLAKRFNTTPEAIAAIVLGRRLSPTLAGERAAKAMATDIQTAKSAQIAATRGTISAKTLANTAISDAQKAIGRRLTMPERGAIVSRVQAEADAILTGVTHGAVPKAARGIPAQPPSKLIDQFGRPAIPAREAIPPAASRYSSRELEQIKEVAAKNARTAYRMDQMGMGVAADPELSKQIASSARLTLNKLPGMPGYNAELKSMMAAQQAIKGALEKSSGEWTPVHIGPISVGAKVPRDKLGAAALVLTDRRFQAFLRHSPRAAAALFMEATQDATNQR